MTAVFLELYMTLASGTFGGFRSALHISASCTLLMVKVQLLEPRLPIPVTPKNKA